MRSEIAAATARTVQLWCMTRLLQPAFSNSLMHSLSLG